MSKINLVFDEMEGGGCKLLNISEIRDQNINELCGQLNLWPWNTYFSTVDRGKI